MDNGDDNRAYSGSELDCNLRINNCLERKFLFLKGKADEKEDNRKKTDSQGKKNGRVMKRRRAKLNDPIGNNWIMWL